tara:strand:+ start:734 stop:1768 length:1035 start_codon:yes stop_codon:yes gene_type:complete
MSTSNKLIATVSSNNNAIDCYLDTAAELSKIDRKNHHQVSEDGKPLVYDLMITVSTPSTDQISAPDKQILMSGTVLTAPNNWQTRNAVRMAHFVRDDLRRESGVSKGAIGKYAKTMRLNLDNNMFDVLYKPTTNISAAIARYQRLYASADPDTLPAHSAGSSRFTGGVWDYTQLAQVETDDANAATDYHLTVCDSHVGSASAGYTTVGVIQAYNERRQTTRDASTVNAGGDTQFVDNDSPFFRVPQQDISEDAYVAITLDEQDNPPYDRSVSGDAIKEQPIEYFQLTAQNTMATFRIQAPLGLVRFDFREMFGTGYDDTTPGNSAWTTVQNVFVEVECLGTYEM